MPRGPSGRLVIEIDPALKRRLHSALVADGMTLKDWFISQVHAYFTHRPTPLFPTVDYRTITSSPALRVADGTEELPQPPPTSPDS